MDFPSVKNQIKRKKNLFLISAFCLLGFFVWLFPRSFSSIKFLGFSDPVFLHKKKEEKRGSMKEIRKPADLSNKTFL